MDGLVLGVCGGCEFCGIDRKSGSMCFSGEIMLISWVAAMAGWDAFRSSISKKNVSNK